MTGTGHSCHGIFPRINPSPLASRVPVTGRFFDRFETGTQVTKVIVRGELPAFGFSTGDRR